MKSKLTSFSSPHSLLSGFLRFLLGLQLGRGPRGPIGQEDGSADRPESPEPGGLRQGERRLRRRVHDQRLQIRAGQQRHRLRGGLPVRRRGEKTLGGTRVRVKFLT